MMGSGIAVDIESGLPLEGPDGIRTKERIQKAERATRDSNLILGELVSSNGEIVKLILESLIARLDLFMAADTECKLLLGLLGKIGHQLNIAPRIAADKVQKSIGPQYDFNNFGLNAAPVRDTGGSK